MASDGAADMALEKSSGANRPGIDWARVTIVAINGKGGCK